VGPGKLRKAVAIMATTTINQSDRDFVMRVLLPRLMRVVEPYMIQLDIPGVSLGAGFARRYSSFQEFYAIVLGDLVAYEPRVTPTGYDSAWANLAAAVNRIAWAVADAQHTLGLLMLPDRYSDALATVRILPEDVWEPAIKFLDVLRGADEMPAILAEIHQYAADQGYPDWSVPVPPSADHFWQRRYAARLADGRQVLVYATGTPASRLVWRVYADWEGREYLGILATMTCEGWRSVRDPERRGTLIPESRLAGTDPGVPIARIDDITVPCGNFEFAQLLAAVRAFVHSKYVDGHVSDGEAWEMAVVMPAMMAGIKVTRSDLRRALAEAGWIRKGGHGYWYEA
jgi:hypothetical protein